MVRAMDATRQRASITGVAGVFVGLAGVSAGLTMLFLGMRRVMEIGGFCAEGGPFVIQHHCPEGAIPLVLGGLWGGLIMAAVYAWQVVKHGARPSLLGLLWPALFLSLGWNFLEFGLNPPGGTGLAWGWLVCAVLFGLMGGVPLMWALPAIVKAKPHSPGSRLGGMLGSDMIASMSRSKTAPDPTDPPGELAGTGGRGRWLVVQLAAVALGIWAGIRIAQSLG